MAVTLARNRAGEHGGNHSPLRDALETIGFFMIMHRNVPQDTTRMTMPHSRNDQSWSHLPPHARPPSVAR